MHDKRAKKGVKKPGHAVPPGKRYDDGQDRVVPAKGAPPSGLGAGVMPFKKLPSAGRRRAP